MNIFELARKLNLPHEVIVKLEPLSEAEPYLSGLCSKQYDRYANELHEALGEDQDGTKILSVMLQAALRAHEEYNKRGIPEEIFFTTMGCFPRFIGEHRESFGTYGFDRWWWTGRQTSLSLFRIGALEFELCEKETEKQISVHIPSDADLSDGEVDESLKNARAFLKKYFPEFAQAQFYCHSWLLAPALGQLLPENSRINRFRTRFTIVGVDEDAEDYKLWVYKNRSLTIDEFPENTTLQKKMKAYLMQGGKVGSAWGVIR